MFHLDYLVEYQDQITFINYANEMKNKRKGNS